MINTCSIQLMVKKESAEKLLCGEAYNRELLQAVIKAHRCHKGAVSVYCGTTDYHKTQSERSGGQFRTSNEDGSLLESIYANPIGWTMEVISSKMGIDDVVFIVSDKATGRKSAIFIVDVSEYDGEYYEQLTMFVISLID